MNDKIIGWKEEQKWSAKINRRISLEDLIELGITEAHINLYTSRESFTRASPEFEAVLEHLEAVIAKKIDEQYRQTIHPRLHMDLRWNSIFHNLIELNHQFVDKKHLNIASPKVARCRFHDPDLNCEIELGVTPQKKVTTIRTIRGKPVIHSFTKKQIHKLIEKSTILTKLGFNTCSLQQSIKEGGWTCNRRK